MLSQLWREDPRIQSVFRIRAASRSLRRSCVRLPERTLAVRKGLYFVPGIFGLVFYCLLAAFGGFGAIHPGAWLCIAMLFVSAALLVRKKWFGCIPGILVGVVLVRMSFRHSGQVIDIERPLGIGLILFCILCGVLPENRK